MKVALIHDWLNGMRGGEKVLEVLADIFPDSDVYTLIYEPEKISEKINKLNVHTSFIQLLPAVKKYYRYYLPFFPAAVEWFNVEKYDLIISSSHCVAKGVKASPDILHICYCHTPIRYVWQFNRDYFKNKIFYFFIKPILSYIKYWDKRSSERVDYFIANSQNVASRIKKYYNKNSIVVYPPVETDFFRPQPIDEDFFLIVSALVPYKKIDLAIRAFNKLKLPLKIIGVGTEWNKLRRLADENIGFLGWQTDDVVRNYYAKCRALIFPGIEDFGITILEAQSCGRPVIAYAGGGALETVIEGSTGLFFREHTDEALVEKVREFEDNANIFKKDIIRENAIKYDRKLLKERLKNEIQRIYNIYYSN